MEYVKEFPNVLNENICNEIIRCFDDEDQIKFNGQAGQGYKPELKKTTDLSISLDMLSEKKMKVKHYESWMQIENIVYETVYYHLKKYIFLLRDEIGYNFFENSIFTDTGFLLQKYRKNTGFFQQHTDNLVDYDGKKERKIVFILYLNSVEEGGETSFTNKLIKPEQGKVIFFPTTWTYVHSGKMPVSNDKYIITGWLYYSENVDINTLNTLNTKSAPVEVTSNNIITPCNDTYISKYYSMYYDWFDAKIFNVNKLVNTYNLYGGVVIRSVLSISDCNSLFTIIINAKYNLNKAIQDISNYNIKYEIKDMEIYNPINDVRVYIKKIYDVIAEFCKKIIPNPYLTSTTSYISCKENKQEESFHKDEYNTETMLICLALTDINGSDSQFQFVPYSGEYNDNNVEKYKYCYYNLDIGSIVILSSNVLKRKSLQYNKDFSIMFSFTIGQGDSPCFFHTNDNGQVYKLDDL